MTARDAGGYWHEVGLRTLAAFLVLWTPFFIFSAHRGHPLPPHTLAGSALAAALLALVLAALCGHRGRLRQTILFACLVALALDVQFDWFEKLTAYAVTAGLVGLFWLLSRHLPAILAATFAALLITTAIVAPRTPDGSIAAASDAPSSDGVAGKGDGQRRIVHLILDEHAGIEGIPDDLPGGAALRAELVEFFASNGFRVFGNAISEYASSRDSISGILNFTSGTRPYERYRGREPFVLTQNAYFDTLAAAGYRIAVNQSTYLDYCSEQRAPVDRCHTYTHDSTHWLADAAIADGEKLKFFFGLYLQLSDIAESLFKAYARFDRAQGGSLPDLPEWDAGPSSMNAMLALDRFIEEAGSGEGNRLYFAHLLLPHGPYAFDAACRLRSDSSTWANHRPPFMKDSTETQRTRSYRYYFEQVRCLKTRLQALFDRLRAAHAYTDAVIILHGDHGSRIAQVAPRAANADRLDAQDFKDAFATLFAVKAPGFVPGYDATLAPVSQLLAETIGRPDLVRRSKGEPTVYLEGEDDEPRKAISWIFSD